MTGPELVSRLQEAGLGHLADAVLASSRPSVRFGAVVVDEPGIPLGASKLGGVPDLPASFVWPRYQGVPQSFIAQVNLAEVAAFDLERVLPPVGVLSFFYDASQSVWGYDPAQDGAWAVYYAPDVSALAPGSLPADLPEEGVFELLRLQPRSEPTFVHPSLSEFDALGFTRKETEAYFDLLDEIADEEAEPLHRLLGHPQPVQGDMQLECQLVSHGLYCGDESGYDDPRAAELAGDASSWRLLLQIDSDDASEMMWGDTGRIYYWIHQDALAQQRWHETRLILQCN